MTSNGSLKTSTSFNVEGYVYWKEMMKFFIEGMCYDIWDDIKKRFFCSHLLIGGVVENKYRLKKIRKMCTIV